MERNSFNDKDNPGAEKEKPCAENYTKFEKLVNPKVDNIDSGTESLLKNLGINLEAFVGNGSSVRTITVINKTSTKGSSR